MPIITRNKEILYQAATQLGIKEIIGQEDNPEVLKYFDICGFDGKKLKDETAWCSAFMNWVAKTTESEWTGKLTARSWLNVGIEVQEPTTGDVVIFWRESPSSWKGHVGIFLREENGWIYTLGGNQGNAVSVKAYPKSRLLGYRSLRGACNNKIF